MNWFVIASVLLSLSCVANGQLYHTDSFPQQEPTVFVILLARNKEYSLPYFLTLFERLDYPKNRISLWIRSDHNIDGTINILSTWVRSRKLLYHSVDFNYSDDELHYSDTVSISAWSAKRFEHIIKLKEEGFSAARDSWADFAWFLDCDVFMTNNQTLKRLVAHKSEIISPMLNSLGMYSNFWCGMTEAYYYARTPDYVPILERKVMGKHAVPMVHSSVLIDLHSHNSLRLTFESSRLTDYDGPNDDIIIFAMSAKEAGIPLYILNDEKFGFIASALEEEETLEDERQRMVNMKLLALGEGNELPISALMEAFVHYTKPDRLGVDQVYLINLERRPERLENMQNAFRELGVQYAQVKAVDGKSLTDRDVEDLGIVLLAEYSDPYSRRPMTKGEIGCFLSHYNIWTEVVENNQERVIVFEDDIKFEPYFRQKLAYMFREIESLNLAWDLIYLGRKRLVLEEESWVNNSKILVHVNYSYWTLSYVLSLEGAKKLLAAKPLTKLVPVDEFLPIMFDKHPNSTWAERFEFRNLKAFSAAPLLVYPTHYTGDQGYVSDTEDSELVLEPTEDLIDLVNVADTIKSHYGMKIHEKSEL